MRNFVFGVEDSLVSTVGFISGIATVNVPRVTILLIGFVLICVEGFSMAVGSFLSDTSAREYAKHAGVSAVPSVIGGLVMLASYVGAGFLVLAPYFWAPSGSALPWSIGISLVALFLLGIVSARMSGISVIRRGIRMLIVGGLAIAIGIIIARSLASRGFI